jgi:precorrin-3B synthase
LSVGVRSIRAVPTPRRSDVDACPGALRLHAAADGPLARVRLPGGLVTGAQLRVIRSLAETWGDAHVELTSRANLQLRALTDAPVAALAGPLAAAGLLPSETHELVRNIAARPLPGRWDVRPLVRELDAAVCADPRLAELPGRFLFALDIVAAADVTALSVSPGEIAVLFAGVDVGLRIDAGQVVATLIAAAHAFLDERAAQGGTAWRLTELPDGPARVAARLGVPSGDASVVPTPSRKEPIGVVPQPGGLVAVGALVPLGRLSGMPMRVLEEADQLVVTPWRGIVVPDLPPAAAASWLSALAEAGLEVTPGSRWSGVTTCAGRPHCAKALADVRHDADLATTFGAGLPVHWIGCARGCGSPNGPHVRVEATGSGYQVTAPAFGGSADAADVGDVVAGARRG